MASETQYKICPNCKTKAALTAPHCLVCGRQYRTQFITPAQTDAQETNEPTGSFTVPAPPPYSSATYYAPPAPPLPPRNPPAPPLRNPASGSFPPRPQFDTNPFPAGSAERLSLNEYSNQFRTLNWCLIWGFFFVWGIIGIAIIVYALIQKPALRRRVAEMGVDPDDWARSMDADALRVFLYALGAVVGAVVVCGVGCALMSGSSSRNSDYQSEPTPQYRNQRYDYGNNLNFPPN